MATASRKRAGTLASAKANIDRALLQPVAAAMDNIALPDAKDDDTMEVRSDLIRATAYLGQAAANKTRHEVNLRRPALSKALGLADRTCPAGAIRSSGISRYEVTNCRDCSTQNSSPCGE